MSDPTDDPRVVELVAQITAAGRQNASSAWPLVEALGAHLAAKIIKTRLTPAEPPPSPRKYGISFAAASGAQEDK